MKAILCTADMNGVILQTSTYFTKELGYQSGNSPVYFSDFIHPDDCQLIKSKSVHAIRSKREMQIEVRLKHQCGKWIKTKIEVKPIFFHDQFKFLMICSKKWQERLSFSEFSDKVEDQLDIYDSLNLVVWSYNLETDKLTVSRNCKQIFGRDAEEFENNPLLWERLIHPDDLLRVNEWKLKASLNQVSTIEYRAILSNGDMKVINSKIIPVSDSSGVVVRVEGYSTDMSHKENKVKELDSKTDVYSSEVFISFTTSGIIHYIDHHLQPHSKRLTKQFKSTSLYSYVMDDELEKIKKEIEEVKGGEKRSFSTLISIQNNLYKVEVSASPLVTNNKVELIHCFIKYTNIDVETKKRLVKQEKELKKIAKHQLFGLYHFDINRNRLIVTKRIEQIVGYSAKDFKCNPMLLRERIHDKDVLTIEDIVQNKYSSHLYEYRIVNKKGETKWLEERIIPTFDPNGKVIFTVGVVFDMTFEKGDEFHAFYQMMIKNRNNGMAIIDTTGVLIKANTIANKITGYSEKELLGMSLFDLLVPEDQNRIFQRFIAITKKDGEISNDRITIFHKEGNRVKLNVIGVPIYKQNEIIGVFVIAEKIDFKNEFANKLLVSKNEFYHVYNQLQLALFLTKPKGDEELGRIIEANELACNKLGYAVRDLRGKQFEDLVFHSKYLFKLNFSNTDFIRLRTILITSEGEKIPVTIYSYVTNWNGERVILSIVQKIKTDTCLLKQLNTFVNETDDAGRQLRILMAELDINTSELAQLTNLSTATVSNLRTGKVKKPNIETAEKIADALGVSISSIWPDINY